MKRRNLLQHGGLAGILAASSAPALAQSMPEVRWRLTSSYPKSLDTLIGAAEHFTKRLADITGGKFQLRVHAAGEIVPGLQVLDAVEAAPGTPMAQTKFIEADYRAWRDVVQKQNLKIE